jgi:hypothetical protein
VTNARRCAPPAAAPSCDCTPALLDFSRFLANCGGAGGPPGPCPSGKQPSARLARFLKPGAKVGESRQSKPPPKAEPQPAPAGSTPPPSSLQAVAHLAGKVAELDRASGGFNLVHLGDLRAAHPEWSRQEFDAVLQRARREGRVTLSSAEGRHGLSPRDQESAVHERGSGGTRRTLLYASVRNSAGLLDAFSRWVVENCGGPGSGVPGPCPKTEGVSKEKAAAARKKIALARKNAAAHAKAREKAKAGKAAPAKKAAPKRPPAPKPAPKKTAAPPPPAPPKPPPAKKPAAPKPAPSPKSAGPMAGHPLAGKTPTQQRQQLIAEGSHTTASQNPRGYDTRNYPRGVKGEAVAAATHAAVAAAVKANPFDSPSVPTLYEAARKADPALTVHQFHGVLAKMQADGKILLKPYTQNLPQMPDASLPFVMPYDREKKFYVGLGRGR